MVNQQKTLTPRVVVQVLFFVVVLPFLPLLISRHWDWWEAWVYAVVSSGPYRWVRHPGYAGALLTYLATPFFLDSLWMFLPEAFAIVVLVIRTRLEDRFLQEELEGYREYARRVRYRLLPEVW